MTAQHDNIFGLIVQQSLPHKAVVSVLFPHIYIYVGMSFQVILAAELLKSADELVKQKIHPTSVISGYRLACK